MAKSAHAVLHLRVLGQERAVSLPVPPSSATVCDLLPAARAAADQVVAMSAETSAAAGSPVTCKVGCHACCRQFIGISYPEVVALSEIVDAMPQARQSVIRKRFSAAIERVREAGLLRAGSSDDAPALEGPQASSREDSWNNMVDAYFYLHIDCPFLEGDRCGIYSQRPLSCREYCVTSPPENCDALGKKPTIGIDLPVRLSTQMAEIHALVNGGEPRLYPLVFALAIAHGHPENSLRKSGIDLLWTLAARLDPQSNVPLQWRAATVA